MSKRVETSVAVIGAGPAGLAAVLALVHVGVRPTLVAPRPTQHERAADTRTFAALGGSVDFLRRLGALDTLRPVIAPLTAIRLIDARGGILRAPEVLFRASEAGLDAFGYNVPQADLGAALATAVAAAAIDWIDEAVAAVEMHEDHVVLTTRAGRSIAASIVAAADGRRSPVRQAAGIATTAWQYPQAAVACVFGHKRSHDNISTEFHGLDGPLTTVPLPDGPHGPRSSLVWVEAPKHAQILLEHSDEQFRATLSQRLQGLLGSITSVGRRAMFPLAGLEVATMAQGRIALIGEAGHVLPPIGAQGLNLGLRDAATFAECIATHGRGDPGSPDVVNAYSRLRARDVWTRTRAVDLLNRSLLSTFLPVDAARGLALHLVSMSAPLRRVAMAQGLEPVGERPRLMRPMTEGAAG